MPNLIDEPAAAERLNVTPGTLRTWRSQGRGPNWIRNPDTGRFLGYDPADVEQWVDDGRAKPNPTR